MTLSRFPTLLSAGILACTLVAPRAAAQFLLHADFQDQPVDQPIGVGGAAAGQPVLVSDLLSAVVRDAPMASRSLELAWAAASSTASFVRFGLTDGTEVVDGELLVEFELLPQTATTHLVAIREASTGARNFGTLVLSSSGLVQVGDGAGFVLSPDGWSPGTTLRPWFLYDMDARVWSFGIGDQTVLFDRPLSPPADGRGIGSLSFGLDFNSPPESMLSIDNIRIGRPVVDALFAHGFEQ